MFVNKLKKKIKSRKEKSPIPILKQRKLTAAQICN